MNITFKFKGVQLQRWGQSGSTASLYCISIFLVLVQTKSPNIYVVLVTSSQFFHAEYKADAANNLNYFKK